MGNTNETVDHNKRSPKSPTVNSSIFSSPSLSNKASNSNSCDSPTVLSMTTNVSKSNSSAISPEFGPESTKTPTKSKSGKRKFKFSVNPLSKSRKSKSSNNSTSSVFDNDNDDDHKEQKEKENNAYNGADNKPQKFVSVKIIEIAADFWNLQVNALSFEEQLEIGVAIYLGMMVKDNGMRQIFKRNFNSQEKISTISLKFLNMMGWLIRTLLRNSDDLPILLKNLGLRHNKFGVNMQHFEPMLESLHETFSHYFPNVYGIKEKYAIDYIFTFATQLMMGQSLELQFQNVGYLQNLEICLVSSVGREYLFRYLQQTYCDEMVIYLQSLMKFKNQTSDKGRFMIARNIIDVSIDPKSNLAINLSFETRQTALSMMEQFETKFIEKIDFKMSCNVFDDVTNEIYKLILENHWHKFVKSIKTINNNH